MKGALQIGLKANEKIYINGAVIQVDRKVQLSLLNEVTFLLGSQVMQLEDATTPMRQLYFLIQSMLIEPSVAQSMKVPAEAALRAISASTAEPDVLTAVQRVSALLEKNRMFEALKTVRGAIAVERQGESLEPVAQTRRDVA